MVTGDNIHTARHIARECGILTEGGLAMEGPEFRKMPIQELLPKLPKLQVSLPCCSPFRSKHVVDHPQQQQQAVSAAPFCHQWGDY
jgi:Ca2+-transporting ATPase